MVWENLVICSLLHDQQTLIKQKGVFSNGREVNTGTWFVRWAKAEFRVECVGRARLQVSVSGLEAATE